MNNDKWQKYLRIDQEDFSASCEVDEGARGLHQELINLFDTTGKVLDIGCGTGWSTEELTKRFDYAVGISIQDTEIDYAIKNHYLNGRLCFELMDMHELNFKDSEFDAVYMRESLEHSIAPFIALCEVNRVLKIGGQFVVNVPSQDWVDWHCHYFVPTEKQLRSLLNKTGFEIEIIGYSAGGHLYMKARKV